MSNTYIKVIPIKYVPGTDTVAGQITRTYSNNVTSLDQINVSFNGQAIPMYVDLGTSGPTANFAKYYWTGSGTGTSTLTLVIHGNQAYKNPNYNAAFTSPLACPFSTDDIIFAEFTYTV